MKDDTISRQAAIDALLEEMRLVDGYYVEDDEVINKNDAIEAIRLLPSAQPEIIRCKDCKWHLTYHDEKYNVGYELCSNPMMMSGDSMIDMSNNDFCSKAERKDNG